MGDDSEHFDSVTVSDTVGIESIPSLPCTRPHAMPFAAGPYGRMSTVVSFFQARWYWLLALGGVTLLCSGAWMLLTLFPQNFYLSWALQLAFSGAIVWLAWVVWGAMKKYVDARVEALSERAPKDVALVPKVLDKEELARAEKTAEETARELELEEEQEAAERRKKEAAQLALKKAGKRK